MANVPEALAAYLALDLTKGSPIAQDLMDRLDAEADRPMLTLTGDGDAGAVSANLTNEMNSWFGDRIAPFRQEALSTVQAAAAPIKPSKLVEGFVVEIENDRLKRFRNKRRNEVRSEFYDNHKGKLDSLADLKDEYEQLRFSEGGRDAKAPPRYLDFLLPVLVMIPETWINYASFAANPLIDRGIVALGVTVAVGIAIGIAAYLTGTFWKAYHYYMKPDDERRKADGLRRIAIASTLLSVSLLVVGTARYYYLMPRIQEALRQSDQL